MSLVKSGWRDIKEELEMSENEMKYEHENEN